MRMFTPILCAALLPLALAAPVPAESTGRAGALLIEPVGARAIGMGNASTAAINDIVSLFANPAGLAPVDNYEALIEIASTSGQDVRQAAAFAFPVQRRSTIAFGLTGLISNRGDDHLRLLNDYSYRNFAQQLKENDYAAHLAWGRFVRPDLSLGVAARYVDYHATSVSYEPEKFRGLYSDLGLRYTSPVSGLVIAATVRNLGGRVSGDKGVHLARSAALGASYGRMRSSAHYIDFSADVVKIEDRDVSFRAGVEYWLANYVGLRVGYDGTEKVRPSHPRYSEWRGGVSVNLFGALLDFAVVPTSRLATAEVTGSLRFSFGEGRKK